ncbi:D-hexose-6-phosphate mutarotase [Chitinimonas naiadis]
MQTIELVSSAGWARISLQGAQVLQTELHGQPLLWASPLSSQEPGKAVRGGVPVCFPWFGKHPDGLPAHGFARNQVWTLLEQTQDRAVFELLDNEATRSLWPHAFRAELAVHLDDGLHFEFTVSNRDATPFRFTYALHSYFAVHDVRRCTVEGLAGRLRREIGHVTSPQEGIVQLQQPIDAVFEIAPDPLVLHDAGRTVQIAAEGMRSAVVWNPGEQAVSIADIGRHWPEYVCVERGNIGVAAVELAPGASHYASMSLNISAD